MLCDTISSNSLDLLLPDLGWAVGATAPTTRRVCVQVFPRDGMIRSTGFSERIFLENGFYGFSNRRLLFKVPPVGAGAFKIEFCQKHTHSLIPLRHSPVSCAVVHGLSFPRAHSLPS